MKAETILQARIRAVLCKLGSPIRLFRNNVGSYPDPNGGKQWITYGLGKGSADLIGLIVGSGRFLGVEIKTATGRQSDEQKAWQRTIQSYGGIAVVLRSVAEAEEFLRSIIDGSFDQRMQDRGTTS